MSGVWQWGVQFHLSDAGRAEDACVEEEGEEEMKRTFRSCWFEFLSVVTKPGEDRMAIVGYVGFPWYDVMEERKALEVQSGKNEKDLRVVVCVDADELKRMIGPKQTEMWGGT